MTGGTGGMAPTAGTTGENPGSSEDSKCFDGITDYFKAGPFKVESKNSGSVKIWLPGTPAGCKSPIVHLANGTGASCSTYAASLQRMASHGFIACCYENANTGAGDQGIMAIDTVMKNHPDKVAKAIGSTGHSQGGQASYIVLAKAEKKYGMDYKYAGLAMQPASGFGSQPSPSWQTYYKGIVSPMMMFSGVGTDGLVSQGWVMDAYNKMSDSVEKIFWAKQGGTHIPVPNGEEMQLSIPWFRWKLLGDQAACKAFKDIPKTDKSWVEVAQKNVKECQ